ncbi:MAG: tyrosine-protein phosphatase [Clostridiales bacterium]|nr:tyrosine-protein phosphatase [Clostridiales bacterium]
MKNQRRIPLENIINCRDLGGYPCVDGSVTKFGRVLRAGVPKMPTERDIEALKEYGVSTVIDFRGYAEDEKHASVFSNIESFNYHHISLLDINPAETEDASLIEYYKLSVDKYMNNIAKVFKALTQANGTVMMHCFFGKDRTGIISAFLLELAGVSMEDIVADYQVSYVYIRQFFEDEEASGSGLIWETNLEHLQSSEKTISELMRYVKEKFGTVESYLKACGVDGETLKKAAHLLK